MVLIRKPSGARNGNAIDPSYDDDRHQRTTQQPIVVDSDDVDVDEDLIGEDDELDLSRVVTAQEAHDLDRALPPGHKFLRSARSAFGQLVEPGLNYELAPKYPEDSNFFRVKYIIQDRNERVYLRGNFIKRMFAIHPKISQLTGQPLCAILPLQKNELCMHLKSTPDILGSPLIDSCLTTIPLDDVMREREIVFTNQEHPAFNYQQRGMSTHIEGKQKVEEEGVLCCRWKFVEEVDKRTRRVVGYQLSGLDQAECDQGKGVPSAVLRRGYGDQQRVQSPLPSPYTCGDGCAGGGGTVLGSKMAGLQPKWAVDKWEVAVDTLRRNFPGTRVLKTSIQGFAAKERFNDDFSVDLIHLSFPCQGHSWRNKGTNPRQDEVNNDTVMCLEQILSNYRPRIVTLEQTDGILTKNEGFFFRKVISQITTMRYNVRWRVMNMAEHGVSQARRRLMIVASAPGQRLPQWPKPTHGLGPGLKTPATLGEAIRNIPQWATLHNVEKQQDAYKVRPLKRSVADQNAPLRHLITTKGVQALLDDGSGPYEPTIRQQMRLTTFTDDYELTGNTKEDFLTQIGNAVPPAFIKQVFEEVIIALKESDEEAAYWTQEVVVLD